MNSEPRLGSSKPGEGQAICVFSIPNMQNPSQVFQMLKKFSKSSYRDLPATHTGHGRLHSPPPAPASSVRFISFPRLTTPPLPPPSQSLPPSLQQLRPPPHIHRLPAARCAALRLALYYPQIPSTARPIRHSHNPEAERVEPRHAVYHTGVAYRVAGHPDDCAEEQHCEF